MSNIDKQALREAAERAESDIGITLTTGLVFVLTEHTGHYAKQLFTG